MEPYHGSEVTSFRQLLVVGDHYMLVESCSAKTTDTVTWVLTQLLIPTYKVPALMTLCQIWADDVKMQIERLA